MYLALRETYDILPDGSAKRVFAGEEVKSFTSWPIRNQMAALSARTVKLVPEADAMPDRAFFEEQGRAFFRPQHRADITAAKQHAMALAIDAHEKQQIIQAMAQTAVEPEPALEPALHACSDCDFSSPSARGLAIHRGRDHKNR